MSIKKNCSYCPFCKRIIYPSNGSEVFNGEHDGFIYVHDEVEHDDDFDFKPLN